MIKKNLISRALMMLAIGLWITPAYSQGNTYTIYGRIDCGEWVTDKANRKTHQFWLAGYLTGLTTWYHLVNSDRPNSQVKDPFKAVSIQQASLWMDNWCKANPLEDIGKGGMHLLLDGLFKK